ncbi:hypothetical protein SISNIDRAFT_490364 [Sistotremastrum niveocremeum HHB9708]|uniref:F-box domain-containing protein n=2 Tax=Sistotremastraceae TaxID=3402574 RepID=A0A164NYV9_9AGAM|nr:hypothetical protein SISNIDRAFT_490364 [Sistotremastrum niveocremeum HHB9708]KZT36508.1 hypothetical protein SISSUDRAFT_1063590 [Sistotremastrum suecicum HHB10207 ss-3]
MGTVLLELPTELITHVLELLDIQSATITRRVCTRFKECVDASVYLTYQTELVRSGYIEGDAETRLSYAERLEEFKKHNNAWTSLSPRSHEVYTLPENSSIWDLYGGVYATGISNGWEAGGRAFHFKELPNLQTGDVGRDWSFEDMGFTVRDFRMKPDVNLIALIEVVRATPLTRIDAIRVHLRTLDDNLKHPMVEHSGILKHRPKVMAAAGWSFCVEIHDNVLALLYTPRAGPSPNQYEIIIWNWMTGSKLSILRSGTSTAFSSFTLLSSDRILIACVSNYLASTRQTQALLATYEFGPGSPNEYDELLSASALNDDETDNGHDELEPDESEELPIAIPDIVYFLPRTCAYVARVLIRSDPPQGTKSSPSTLFSIDPNSRIYAVTIHAVHLRDGGHGQLEQPWQMRCFTLLIQSRVFVKNPRIDWEYVLRSNPAHDREINAVRPRGLWKEADWSDWGPMHSRILLDSPRSEIWVCYVYGDRYIERTEDNRIRVLDFNPAALRYTQEKEKEKMGVFSSGDCAGYFDDRTTITNGGLRCVTSPTIVDISQVFDEKVETVLPYRECVSDWQVPSSRAVMIDAEHIVLADRNQDTLLECYTF